MTVWLNGHEVTPAKRTVLHCDRCGAPGATIAIDPGGTVMWLCAACHPALQRGLEGA